MPSAPSKSSLATTGPIWSWTNIRQIVLQSYDEWNRVEAPRMGAALAYYTLFSLAPLLLLMTGIAGLVFDPAAVRDHITGQLSSLVGAEGGEAVGKLIEQASSHKSAGAVATVFGLVTLLLGASSVALELRSCLNKIFAAKESQGVAAALKERSYATAIVLGAGFLLVVSLTISAALAAMGGFFTQKLPIPAGIFEAINFVISLAVFAGIIAAILYFLPTHRPGWQAVKVGALATAILFTIGKTLIGLYIGKAGVASAYGAAGSLVVLLVWVYYSAQILFFGAAFTKVYADRLVSAAKQ